MAASPILGNFGVFWIMQLAEGKLDGHSLQVGRGLACAAVVVLLLTLFKSRDSVPEK